MLTIMKSLSSAQISPELWLPLETTPMCYRDLQDTEQQAQDTDQKGQSGRQDKPRKSWSDWSRQQ